jgi:hypothetical protein
LATLIALATCAGEALAGNKYSCCNLASADGACVSQGSSCNLPPWGAELALFWVVQRADGWEIDGNYNKDHPWMSCGCCPGTAQCPATPPGSQMCGPDCTCPPGVECAAPGWQWVPPVDPGELTSSFPAGTNGYLEWIDAPAPTWVGVCLDAQSSADPMHAGPTEPLGCMRLSLKPGVRAQLARFDVPSDPRWDGFQWCYGGQTKGGGDPCANVNDLNDPTVSPTPVSGSCCSAAQLFRVHAADGVSWEVDTGQQIPGAPPPVVYITSEGGFDPYYDPDADTIGNPPQACVPAYNEPANCGSPPASNAPPGSVSGDDGGTSADAAGLTGSSGGKGCACATSVSRGVGPSSLAVAAMILAARGIRRRRHPHSR